ncbi:MAG: FxsA family protein [Chloroflexi bacterium]|nr:FxsA family protein [Chloroflexota bacterium]
MRVPLIGKLIAVLVGVPLLDLGAVLLMSHYTGIWVALGTVVACGVLGAFLVRREGIRTWNSLRQEIARGQMPETPLLDAVLVLVSGVMLMTPGPLTDALGLILLLPPVRQAVRLMVRRKVEKMLAEGAAQITQNVVRSVGGVNQGAERGSSPTVTLIR